MNDEHPDSLAAQAASWVPPWEREQPPLDRDYQAAAAGASDEPDAVEQAEGDQERTEADLSDDDDFDVAFEGPHPPGYQPSAQVSDVDSAAAPDTGSGAGDAPDAVPAELPPFPEESSEPVTVDSPAELEGDSDSPLEVGVGPDLDVPTSIEEAGEAADDDAGAPVDAPLPPDGDDAGDVFDAAADDDLSDDDEVDLPFAEEVPEAAPDELPPPDTAAAATGSIPGQGRRPRTKAAAVESRTPEVDLFEAAPIDDPEFRAALEAILLVVDEPVAEMQLAQIMEQPAERVASMLDDISARYTAAGHGFDLRRAAGGWRLYTRPEYAAYVERFVLDGQSVRLTQAALETLAVVAYKQPVTRSRISAIRGVNCDGVMRTLTTRGLIEECGTEGETGAYLYRTTGLFLEKLGLNSVDQLPPLAPFLPDDVEEVIDASG